WCGRGVGTLASPSSCSCARVPPPARATQASLPRTTLPPPLRGRRGFRSDMAKYLPVKAGVELGGVGTLASPWQEGAGARGSRTRATQASPPRLIPTPAPTGTKALPRRDHTISTLENRTPLATSLDF